MKAWPACAASLGLSALVALGPGSSNSEPIKWKAPPRHRLLLSDLLVLRLNPTGVENRLELGYRRRLFERNESLVLRDSWIGVGAGLRVNPAYVQAGPVIELQPVAVFNLRVSVEYVGYFGGLGIVQSFASPLDRYSDRALQDRSELGKNYGARALRVAIEPLLQAQLGPIALRNRLGLEYWYLDGNPDDRVFYESTQDALVPMRGWVLSDDIDLLYLHPNARRRFIIGARYSVVRALYSSSDFRPGEDRSRENNLHQRLGPVLAYTFFERAPGTGRWNSPTLVLIVNWYLDHRYRTGREASALFPTVYAGSPAIPYAVLAFAFESDLAPRRASPLSASRP